MFAKMYRTTDGVLRYRDDDNANRVNDAMLRLQNAQAHCRAGGSRDGICSPIDALPIPSGERMPFVAMPRKFPAPPTVPPITGEPKTPRTRFVSSVDFMLPQSYGRSSFRAVQRSKSSIDQEAETTGAAIDAGEFFRSQCQQGYRMLLAGIHTIGQSVKGNTMDQRSLDDWARLEGFDLLSRRRARAVRTALRHAADHKRRIAAIRIITDANTVPVESTPNANPRTTKTRRSIKLDSGIRRLKVEHIGWNANA
jgi:hypothetical protein